MRATSTVPWRPARAVLWGFVICGALVGLLGGQRPTGLAGVDIVLECSGKFRTAAQLAPYFKRGVRKVIVAAIGASRLEEARAGDACQHIGQ